MLKRLFLFLPLVLSCSSPSPAPETSVGKDQQAIQGGQVDVTSAFAIALVGGGLCSGTLIAPNLVLTARHCVETEPDQSGTDCENGHLSEPAELEVTTDSKLDFNGGRPSVLVGVSRILPMPEVTKGCSPDIALVELAKPIPASVAKPARPAVEPAFARRPHFSDHVTAIGFGIDDTGLAGQRRIKQNLAVLCVPGDTKFPCDRVEPGADYEIIVAPGPCSGDSGGGLYDQATFDAKDPVVVATVSRGPVGAGRMCGPGVFVRVDKFKEFIIARAIEAAANGGYPKPTWAVIEPVTDAGPDAAPIPAAAPAAPETLPTSAGPATTTTTTTGCTIRTGGQREQPSGLAVAGLGALGALVARSRRRAPPLHKQRLGGS